MAYPDLPQKTKPKKLSFQTGRVITALILREMSTTYGRSPGGYIWAVLEPVGGVALLTLAFSFFFRSPPIGSSFPLFYASGLLPFMMFMELSKKISTSIRFSKPLLSYPKVTFLDAILARLILNLGTQILVFYIVIGGILWFENLSAQFDYAKIFLALLMTAGLALAVGAMNCVLFAFFPLWERIWVVLTRPLLLISCLFYTFESMPATLQSILWWNPLAHIAGLLRDAVYQDYSPEYVSLTYVLLLIIVLASFGVHFVRRYHKIILNEL